MQNSSLHSFSLRLHFHAQYLQNKAYKHLIAKIFPEQLGYLALSAPSYFPSASLQERFYGRSGEAKLPTRSRSAGAASGTQRCPRGCPSREHRQRGCPRRARLPASARRASGSQRQRKATGGRRSRVVPAQPRPALKARRAEGAEAPKLQAARCTDVPLSLEVKAAPHRGSAAAPAGAALPGGR